MNTELHSTINGSKTFKPIKKVKAAGLAGAVVTIIVWASGQFFDLTLAPEIIAAIEMLIISAAAYMTPPGEGEGAGRNEV